MRSPRRRIAAAKTVKHAVLSLVRNELLLRTPGSRGLLAARYRAGGGAPLTQAGMDHRRGSAPRLDLGQQESASSLLPPAGLDCLPQGAADKEHGDWRNGRLARSGRSGPNAAGTLSLQNRSTRASLVRGVSVTGGALTPVAPTN